VAVNERSEVIFLAPARDVVMATNFVGPVQKIGFACDSRDGVVRQKVQELNAAEPITDQLTIINSRLGG